MRSNLSASPRPKQSITNTQVLNTTATTPECWLSRSFFATRCLLQATGFQMPPEPSHQGPMFYCSVCAHTKHLPQQRNNRLARGPISKAHHNSPQNPTLPLVCAKTPTLRLLLPAPEKFCISPALACMFGYKLLIMKCELLFRSFAIQPCASLSLACILSPLPDVW